MSSWRVPSRQSSFDFLDSTDEKPDIVFRSNSPGPGEFYNMQLHSGLLVCPLDKENMQEQRGSRYVWS